MEYLKLDSADMARYAQLMAESLAVMHLYAKINANDVDTEQNAVKSRPPRRAGVLSKRKTIAASPGLDFKRIPPLSGHYTRAVIPMMRSGRRQEGVTDGKAQGNLWETGQDVDIVHAGGHTPGSEEDGVEGVLVWCESNNWGGTRYDKERSRLFERKYQRLFD
ncbi:hypothetical protein AJ80_02647 [Polytolypa hystricis UAMH7299]|uniref:Uncharacterized protein n=1 Tax=Polytolypa hystricis (strain UAMH7299) TaxID=1447883 RepID=A0A2B7YQA4_POLH7|nr:hypothetical protein AJ80_02647 [Polytolypa hystricis UAMH7299]